jgi:hypothetical protein
MRDNEFRVIVFFTTAGRVNLVIVLTAGGLLSAMLIT